MASLTGISSLGTIISEERMKDAQLFQSPLPFTDSSSALILDLFGVQGTITVRGVFTTSDGTISTMIGQLDALVSGSQLGNRKTYVSDISSTYYVYIQSVRWVFIEGSPNKVEYEISMIEGE